MGGARAGRDQARFHIGGWQAMTKWLLVVLPLLAAACATIPLTPEQSARLKEAQRFADEVTNAYGVQPVRLLVYKGPLPQPWLSWGRYLAIGATELSRDDIDMREKIVGPLAFATLGYLPDSPTAEAHRRQYVFDANRRSVEIHVRFLGRTTRQAVEDHAAGIVRWNEELRRKPPSIPLTIPPCEQLRDVWSHFAMTDPMPTCETGTVSK
jgi:hypothetical protein